MAPEAAWQPWLGLIALGSLCVLVFLWWLNHRRRRNLAPGISDLRLEEARFRALFDNTPVQILELDFTHVVEVFSQLRAEGVTNLMAHVGSHLQLWRKLQGLIRLTNANRAAVAAAGLASEQELKARLPHLTIAPYPEIFYCQLDRLWIGRRQFEEEFRYLDANGRERVCLMQCKVSEREGQPDLSCVMLVLLDITATRRTVEAQMENQGMLSQILSRANVLLWWAKVRREGGRFRWKINVPAAASDSPVYKLATAIEWGGLWDAEYAPDSVETVQRAEQAMLTDSPGYQQEYRVLSREKALHWLSENVVITRLGKDEWLLVGATTDVTAQHEAEEAQRASEARLQQLLNQANCVLWQATVVREGDQVRWGAFAIPGSALYKRIFGREQHTTGSKLWSLVNAPDRSEMQRRSDHAIRAGAPGYEQEFRVIGPEKTIWLHEQVSITPAGPDRWNLVGVLMDVTARHEAEEARRASEAQLHQILERADCLLWQARVQEVDGNFDWQFEIPASGLKRRVFGGESTLRTGDLYGSLTVPELAEMRVRSAAALRSGAPGYEQEFRIVRPGRTYWLHERVSIIPQEPGRWRVFGVMVDVSALKEAEQAIRASEARYRDLFENAVEGVFQSTPEGRFLSVNPSLALIFGCATPDEFMAWSSGGAKSLYVKPGRRAEFFLELGARDSVADFESEVRCRDGSTKWITESVRAVRDGAGRLLYLQGFLSDVTERRKALQAVRDSEARLRAFFENVPVAILELDFREVGQRLRQLHAAGEKDLSAYFTRPSEQSPPLLELVHIAAANDAAMQLYRAESKEHLCKDFSRAYNAGTRQAMQLVIQQIWEGHNRGETDVKTQDFAGGLHHLYAHWWMPRPREWLQLQHMVVGLVDLTELKRAEAELAAEKERLAVTLRAMSEGVITIDTQGVVQYMNRAAEALTQQEAAAAIGRPLAEVCVLQEAPSNQILALPIVRVFEEGILLDLPPLTMLAGRQGASCQVEGCCAPVRDADSRLIGAVLVIRDVTDRQRFEQELQRASRLESIGILAGGIAHDFNNILTAIMGNITLALLDAGAPARTEGYLREAERATLRARDLTQQLLTFAKGGDPVRAAVLLPEIITEVAQFALHGSRVKCEFDLPAGLWPADADKGQLSQVVQNLVINAIQAMPEGGTIRIGARNEPVRIGSHQPFTPGDYVHIFVADTGTGIKPEHRVKIFDPYFTTKQSGSGLGLTTVYSIIKKHHGHIEVESELGQGTTFHLWLPALSEHQLDFAESSPAIMTPLKGRVLFMDDEEPIVQMADLLLQRLGFEVEVAREGLETVRKFAAAHAAGRPFDLVVMDLTVPGGIGGREAIAQLHQIDPGVKAIVSSGYSSDPVLANYRSYGFRGMVAKPYQIDDLTRVLREVLSESRSTIPGTLSSRPEGG
ncbi:MAG: PAS domain S-box protein [Opitutaceae bacterium]|nr:PAS domain S-box protein [Opitutaceae bacterium]